jgi:hypothetical protein
LLAAQHVRFNRLQKDSDMKSMKIVVATMIAAIALPALAQISSTHRIDERQREQRQQIDEGVRSGQLNSREASVLRNQQAKIRQMERQAMADGVMSNKEKAKIEYYQDKESLRIAKQTHNLHTAN